VRVGLLSTANINRHLLGGARAAEGVEVVAVASRERERAEAYAAEHGLGRAHGSYDALLADDEVDAVYVPLPNSLHVESGRSARSRPASTCCARSR
jgi:xylose dehydrogenase (NAD/NADP)